MADGIHYYCTAVDKREGGLMKITDKEMLELRRRYSSRWSNLNWYEVEAVVLPMRGRKAVKAPDLVDLILEGKD